MLIDIYRKETTGLYETPIVQQTSFWSAVKNKLGTSTAAFEFRVRKSGIHGNLGPGETVNADLLAVIQKVNAIDCIAYVPYGPELEPDEELQGRFLEELSECLRSFLPKGCFMIRYDLCWESYWGKDRDYKMADGNFNCEPDIKSQELRFNFNTINWNFQKASSNILPSNTYYINLQSDPDSLLGRMKPKTRYNIGLSQRRGVTVRPAGMEGIDTWYRLYQETAHRNKIYLNDIKYFEAIISATGDNTSSPAEAQLLIAETGSTPLAAMFLVISGNRGSYLYGASSDTHRNLMATYALQWEAMKISRERGCTEYDMFGVAPDTNPSHPLHGLYRFKSGFGGTLYRSLGCWDYPLNSEKYHSFRNSEIGSRGYHIN